ncbi:hypothetical protein Lal_00018764 [Lupinus albus]|nr:hypothetical protein Lal_00018764 [Lupinus albus]
MGCKWVKKRVSAQTFGAVQPRNGGSADSTIPHGDLMSLPPLEHFVGTEHGYKGTINEYHEEFDAIITRLDLFV